MTHAFRGQLRADLIAGLGAPAADAPDAPGYEVDAPAGYDVMATTLRWRPDDESAEPVEKQAWTPCHLCARPIPVRRDRVERGVELRDLDSWSYVCPFCGATQLGSAENSVDAQSVCHGCTAALDDGPACGACGLLRGWAVARCPRCQHGQVVCMPHLAVMCDAYTLQCVNCEIVTYSFCIC